MKKILVLGLSVWQIFFAVGFPTYISAQELEIQTGDVVAVSSLNDAANITETLVDVSEESVSNITTEQDLVVDILTESEGSSGEATISGELEANVITGDSIAISDTISNNNLNIVNGSLDTYSDTIIDPQVGDIDLNSVIQDSFSEMSDLPSETVISTDQTSEVKVETKADSNTGEITSDAEQGSSQSGDSIAVANSVSLTNLNLVGSNGLIFIINIANSLVGDILIPNLDELKERLLPGELEIITNQTATVDSESNAISDSGNITTTGNSNSQTGDTLAVSNNTSFTNLVGVGNDWTWLLINNYGNWNGSLQNWQQPGTSEVLGYGTTVLEKNDDSAMNNEGKLTVVTNQNADVSLSTLANSGTGNISITGGGEAKTGDASSLANSLSLTNFVDIGGTFVLGIVNILGDWTGNLNVAYPDLSISITDRVDTIVAGASQKYFVSVKNNGKAKAKDITVNFKPSADFVTDSINLNKRIDELGVGQSLEYEIDGLISSTALSNTEITALVTATLMQDELSKDNNSGSDSTLVVLPTQTSTNKEQDERTPDLKINLWNNVNDFVYPGDTVQAKITITNQSPFIARNVIVNGTLSNNHPMPAIPMQWDLGNLRAGEKVDIEFSIGLIEELPDGVYHLKAEASGKSETGKNSSTGWITSDFLVKLKYYVSQFSGQVMAQEDVMGVSAVVDSDTKRNILVDNQKYLPYILAISIIMLILISYFRKKLKRDENE